MMKSWITFSALVLCALPLARLSSQAASVRPLVTKLMIRGVNAIDASELSEGLATQPTKCRSILYTPICRFSRAPVFAQRAYLDDVELRRDLLRIRLFYWRRGYRDIVVTSRTERARGGTGVVFAITENAPTVAERIEVVQPDGLLSAGDLRALLTVDDGEPIDLVAIDSARALMRDALWERGYADSRIELDTSGVSNETNRGPVILTVLPGRRAMVQRIKVEGAKRITPGTVQRLMNLSSGDIYRLDELLESQRRLYLSGLFTEVDIGALPTADSAKTVVVRVTEGPLNRAETTGGLTTADFLQLQAEFSRYHFLGGARRLTLRTTLSNLLAPQLNGSGPFYDVTNGALADDRELFLSPTWSASVDFLQPWAFGPRNQLGASLFTHRRSQPGVVTDRGVGGTMAITRDLARFATVTLGYTYEASTIEASDVYFCVSIGLCVGSAIDVVSQRNPLAPLSLGGRYDDTNDPFQPTRGVRARLDLEHASGATGSDFAYNRATVTASTYHSVTRAIVAAARLRLGFVRALAGTNRRLGVSSETTDLVIHPRKFFFAGGAQSVRGYGENQLGPRVLTIDPARLTDSTLATPCTLASLTNGTCDPDIDGLSSAAFQPRPLGGSALAEANLELRFPLLKSFGVTGAVFVDAAIVGTRRFGDLLGATATVTPGFGVRVDTPAGPVRLDLGIRPRVVERLPVITQVTEADSTFRLVTLGSTRRFDQAEASGGFLKQVFSRLTLHLAIGSAF